MKPTWLNLSVRATTKPSGINCSWMTRNQARGSVHPTDITFSSSHREYQRNCIVWPDGFERNSLDFFQNPLIYPNCNGGFVILETLSKTFKQYFLPNVLKIDMLLKKRAYLGKKFNK